MDIEERLQKLRARLIAAGNATIVDRLVAIEAELQRRAKLHRSIRNVDENLYCAALMDFLSFVERGDFLDGKEWPMCPLDAVNADAMRAKRA